MGRGAAQLMLPGSGAVLYASPGKTKEHSPAHYLGPHSTPTMHVPTRNTCSA